MVLIVLGPKFLATENILSLILQSSSRRGLCNPVNDFLVATQESVPHSHCSILWSREQKKFPTDPLSWHCPIRYGDATLELDTHYRKNYKSVY